MTNRSGMVKVPILKGEDEDGIDIYEWMTKERAEKYYKSRGMKP